MLNWIRAWLYRRRIVSRLSRFMSGELPRDARQEVARALDDPIVYAEYRRQRDMSDTFRSDMSGLGRADRTVFQRGWENVARVLEQTTPSYRLSVHTTDWRVRLAAVGLVAALLVPMGLNAGRVSANNVPTQPVPLVAHHDVTATSEIVPESTPEDTPSAAVVIIYLTTTPIAPSK